MYINAIEEFKFISERMLMVSLKMKLDTLYIFSVYAPEDCKPKTEQDLFYETLQDHLDRIPASKSVLILGDLNARIGNDMVYGMKQRFNEDVTNENRTMFTQFCADNELRINNTFFQHKTQYKITWQNTRGQQSTTDYIVSNRKIHPSQIVDVRSLNSADNGSDHSLVLCKMRLLLQKNRKDFITEEHLNKELLTDESRLEGIINENPLIEEDEVNDNWKKLKTNILRAGKEALGTRMVKIPPQTQRKRHGFVTR